MSERCIYVLRIYTSVTRSSSRLVLFSDLEDHRSKSSLSPSCLLRAALNMRPWTVSACLRQVVLFSSLAAATPHPRNEPSPSPSPAAASCNTPSNRACWTEGFDINTDWETKTPITGVTRTVGVIWIKLDHRQLTGPCIVHVDHHRSGQLCRGRWPGEGESNVDQRYVDPGVCLNLELMLTNARSISW